MNTLVSMATWFGLKDGRSDFTIRNDEDAAVMFARDELDDRLQRLLRKSFRTGKPPKFVLYGDWGAGKTHTLHHLEHVLHTQQGNGVKVYFVDFPDVSAKTGFRTVHGAILDAIGMTTVQNWIVQYFAQHQANSHHHIHAKTQSEDVARAFSALVGYGDGSRIAWDWLRGSYLTASDARSAGLPAGLDETNHLVGVLKMIGELSQEIDGAQLLIMLDEADKLIKVTHADTLGHWLNAMRALADPLTTELGLIIAGGFNDPDEMPPPLSDQQVVTRFGEKNYLPVEVFGDPDAKTFITRLLEEWIDDGKRKAIVSSHSAESDGEPTNPDSFPFTGPALDLFIEYTTRNGGITRPRDLQHDLDDVLNRAMDDARHILCSTYVSELLAEGF